ncbi:MAG: hypothetical protein K5787_03090 [Lentisphaeria bacterium]|nr:hypothetical protein [Lentisphaeria bacterium]
MSKYVSDLIVTLKNNAGEAFRNALISEGLGKEKCEKFHYTNGANECYLTLGEESSDNKEDTCLECVFAQSPTAQDFAMLRKKIRIFAQHRDLKVAAIRLDDGSEGMKSENPQMYLFSYPLPNDYYLIPKDDAEKAKEMKKYFYRLSYAPDDLKRMASIVNALDDYVAGFVDAVNYDWASGGKIKSILPIELTTYDENGNEIDRRPFPCEIVQFEAPSEEMDDEEIEDVSDASDCDLSVLEQFPKSEELHKPGGILSKLVCSCGGKKFRKKAFCIGGVSLNGKGYSRTERLYYNYVCEKCGAEIYLGGTAEETYFFFVSKDKQELAQSIAETGNISFGKDFCIASRWGDIIPNADYSRVYHFLKLVLDNPNKVFVAYSQGVVGNSAADDLFIKVNKECIEGFEQFEIDDELEDEDKRHSDDCLAMAKKPEKVYTLDFTPGISFAIDVNGELHLNDNPEFVPEAMEDYNVAKFRKYREAIDKFQEIDDEYVRAIPFSSDGLKKLDDLIKKADAPSMIRANALVVVDAAFLGVGSKLIIGPTYLYDFRKVLVGASVERILFSDIKKITKNSNKILLEIPSKYDSPYDIPLKGPSDQSIDKIYQGLKLLWEAYNMRNE